MKGRWIATIDRWGPGVIAVLTLCAVVVIGWQYDIRIARVEGRHEVVQMVADCTLQQARLEQRIGSLERKTTKDREDWEFAAAKLEHFKEDMIRLLIRAKLME